MAGERKKFHVAGADSTYWEGDLRVAAINLPPVAGDRRRKVFRAKSLDDLRTKVRVFNELRERTGQIPGTSPTVEQWMNYWLDNVATNDVRPKTLSNYRSMTKRHIIPNLGKTRLNQLTAASVRDMNQRVIAATSSTTALTVHRIFSSALAAAEREGKVARNYAQLVRAPRRDIVQLEVLTAQEAKDLVAMFGAREEAYLWATFLLTGARRGEILGLEWDRISDVLDLSWQLQRQQAGDVPVDYERRPLGHGLFLTRPKSRSGVRVVPMFEPLKSILDRWRLVAPTNEHGLVFTMPNGSPIDPDYASRQWPKILKAAGITRHVRLHDLRHTAVDLLYEAGVREDAIREIVGHSAITMTRAYKSKASRERLAAELVPFANLFTQPDPDMPRAIGE